MKRADLIDKKVLFLHYPVSKFNILEGKVKEYSPSNNFIKINTDWYLLENLRILEIFPEEKKQLGF
jgi:uncharacterized membrane protein